MNEPTTTARSFRLERDFKTGQATAIVIFDCPNCGKRHSRREIYSQIPANFGIVGYLLKCGAVRVSMPWKVPPLEMDTYGQHVLLSAIKYLDGAPNGCEGSFTANERRAAIRFMLAMLPVETRAQLEKDRAAFWMVK